MKERAHLLGPRESILAIVHEPEPPPPAERPTILVLNAGIVHRIGPHRISVRLARALATAGFRVVRIDLSGIGDSAARPDGLGFEEAAVADIREVMDDLSARHRANAFVLFGICSGADNSFQTAHADPRVVGAALIDGVVYPTPGFYLRRYGRSAKRPSAWVGLAKRGLRSVRARLKAKVVAPEPAVSAPSTPTYVREFPPKKVFEKNLQGLVDRGVKMHWIFTSGVAFYQNYERQFLDCFRSIDFKDRLTYTYFPESNHTFTELREQRRLAQVMTEWAVKSFPA